MLNIQNSFLYLWFYVGWFGCLYTAQIKQPLLSLIFPILLLVFLIIKRSLSQKQWWYLGLFMLLGLVFDYVATYLQLIQFYDSHFYFLPIWLISLWVLFVLTLPLMAQFFAKHLVMAFLLGAIFGPLSYSSGAQFGVVEISNKGIMFYSIFWALYFLLTMFILGRVK